MFTGSTVKSALAREFWLQGELSTPCCVVWFRTEQDRTWKLDYDDENMRWELTETDTCPAPGTSEGDEEFYYPIVELAPEHSITGRKIVDFEELDEGTAAVAHLRLSGGVSIRFVYNYESDHEYFETRNTSNQALHDETF